MGRNSGLSLVELLMGLVVLSVLVSLAAPSFSTMIAEQRLREASNELRVSLATARSEAIKRGEAVLVLPRDASWNNGWCVQASTSASGCASPGIQAFVVGGNVEITTTGALRFDRWGRVAGCPQIDLSTASSGTQCKTCLSVTLDGRVLTRPGSCTSVCPEEHTDATWAGSCL